MLCGDLNGKEIQKRGGVCIRMVDSFCCTAKGNTDIVNQLCSSKKFFKNAFKAVWMCLRCFAPVPFLEMLPLSGAPLPLPLWPKRSHPPNDDASEKPCLTSPSELSPFPRCLNTCLVLRHGISEHTLHFSQLCEFPEDKRGTLQWGRNKCMELNWKQKANVKTFHLNMPLHHHSPNLPPPQPSPAGFYPREDKVLISWADRNTPSKSIKALRADIKE